jgi:SAM-dependent methyltransferase
MEYQEWNCRWGAPFGYAPAHRVALPDRLARPDAIFGPFGFQANSDTRVFEYPWAYFAAAATPGMRVLEVGGGTSGLQFVFAREGCETVNVDPGIDTDGGLATSAGAWQSGPDFHRHLNAIFGANVELIQKRLQDADLAAGSFDRVLCLSVLEHLDPAEGREIMECAARLLAPGGLLVVTIDLFLELEPFGLLTRNRFGANVDVHRLTAGLGLDLVHGDRRELYGYPEFDRDRIVDLIDEVFVSPQYPVVTQTVVLRRPESHRG